MAKKSRQFLPMIVQSCDIHEVEQLNPSSQNWLKGKFEGHSFFRSKTNCFWFQFLTNQSIAFRFLGITKNILELDGPGMAVTSNSYGPIPISILSHEPKEQNWTFVFAKAQVFQFLHLPWINQMISPCFRHGKPAI